MSALFKHMSGVYREYAIDYVMLKTRARMIPPSDRISSREMLDLVCLFPLQELGRFAVWFLTVLCLPPPGLLYPEVDDEEEEDDRDDHAFAYSSSSAAIATYQNHFHLHFE
ncbi:hypothetical protein Bca4012_088189 [Brassica carinata]